MGITAKTITGVSKVTAPRRDSAFLAKRALAVLCILGMASVVSASNPSFVVDELDSFEFDVYLDDARIGSHWFEISESADGQRAVSSEASFNVKFLFITAFRYQHSNAERWVDGCLAEIEARTDSNGKRTRVTGEATADGFLLNNGSISREIPECVMTFAYWNPEFLDQPRLLNPQTGEYLAVDVEPLEEQPLTLKGEPVDATAWRIRARGVEVTVWYSRDNQWLALESPAKGGRTLRYELS